MIFFSILLSEQDGPTPKAQRRKCSESTSSTTFCSGKQSLNLLFKRDICSSADLRRLEETHLSSGNSTERSSTGLLYAVAAARQLQGPQKHTFQTAPLQLKRTPPSQSQSSDHFKKPCRSKQGSLWNWTGMGDVFS